MTLKTCLDTVRIRANNYGTTINLDEPQVRNEINWAVHDVVIRTLPFMDKYFIKTGVAIADGGQIPYEFLGSMPLEVVRADNGLPLFPCKPDEFISIQWDQLHPPSNAYPKYTIQGSASQNRVFNTMPASISCLMSYWAPPPELDRFGADDAKDLGIPDSLSEPVILRAVWGCFLKQNEKDKMMRVIGEYRKAMESLGAVVGSDLKQTLRLDKTGIELPANTPVENMVQQ